MSVNSSETIFLKEESNVVLSSVQSMLSQDQQNVVELFKTKYSQKIHQDSVPFLNDYLLSPVLDIANRGGKGWRSFLMITVCEAIGKNAELLHPWTGIIELLHVGSLIIDDIQDNSEKRRGGPTCHKIYGEAIALNAGNTAYFLIDKMIESLTINDRAKLDLYQLFFGAMRAAHAGQALDIVGLEKSAIKAIATKNFEALILQSVEIHRLKTGIPVALCMKIGAIVAEANEQQLKAVTEFGEAVGIVFQIGDDIINLKGFENNLKIKGEDIAQGKITFPIAVALNHLPFEEAEELIYLILLKKEDQEHINYVLDQINKVNALEISMKHAKKMILDAWNNLDMLLPESEAKKQLLMYGNYFLQKHY